MRTQSMNRRTRRLGLHLMAIGLAAAAIATSYAAPGPIDEPLLQRALEQSSRRVRAYQTVRHLRAATLSGKHEAWMDAEVAIADGAFSYRVLDEGGSKRTRDKVLRAVLDAERDLIDRWELSALTLDNYTFEADATPRADGLRTFRLLPRRDDPRLVEGTITVSPEGHLTTLEGRLAKNPSFWTRSVTVIRRFATINGLTLPVSVESLAEVRFVGPSTFSMSYEYARVDGQPVENETVARSTSPSSRLLALFTRFKQAND